MCEADVAVVKKILDDIIYFLNKNRNTKLKSV